MILSLSHPIKIIPEPALFVTLQHGLQSSFQIYFDTELGSYRYGGLILEVSKTHELTIYSISVTPFTNMV